LGTAAADYLADECGLGLGVASIISMTLLGLALALGNRTTSRPSPAIGERSRSSAWPATMSARKR
jgi:uncharacterized membrane-anchored protein